MDYCIIIKSAAILSSKDFAAQLKRRWPSAVIETSKSPRAGERLQFELPMAQRVLHGSLAQDGKGVFIHSGGVQDCAEFTQWCRSLIPSLEDVVFCDDSMSIDVSLTAIMSTAEIASIILSS